MMLHPRSARVRKCPHNFRTRTRLTVSLATDENAKPDVKKAKAAPAASPKPKGKATKKAAEPVVEEKKVEEKAEKPAKKAKATKAEKPVAEKKAEKPISENRKKLRFMKDAPDAEAAKNKADKKAKAAPVDEEEEVAGEDSDVEMEDDQTAALLKGFESDSDSDDEMAEKDNDLEGQDVGEHEVDKKTRKALAKAALKAAESKIASEPGTVYLGRIPHGFYENEMRQYFKQFGDILQLRLSRNKKTGASKHYAFIQFSSGDVASIVAKTMDNYLLFGHILKAKVVPAEQVHESLWEGANKRFKKVPWNKIEGRKLEMGMTEAGWDKRVAKEHARRERKAAEMKAMGYTFTAPTLKAAQDVEKRPVEQVILTTEEEVVVEEPVVEEAKPKASKSKRKAEEEIVPEKKQKKTKAAEPAREVKALKTKKTTTVTKVVEEEVVAPVAAPEQKKLKRKASAGDLKATKKTRSKA